MENMSITQLQSESHQWEGTLFQLFNLKSRTFGTISHSKDEQKALDVYNGFLNQCADSLASIPIAQIPDPQLKERTEYKLLIIGEIDKRETVYDQARLDVHLEKVVSSVFDYGYGPIVTYRILNSPDQKSIITKLKTDGIKASYGYAKSYEQGRLSRSQELLKQGKRPLKTYGRGDWDIREPEDLSRMVFNLYEFAQPKLHLLDMDEEKVSSIRSNVETEIDELYRLREKLGRRLKGRVVVPLVTNPKVKDLLLDEIRPRNVYDLCSAHPLRLKVDNMLEDKEYQKDEVRLVTPYIKIFGHSRYCSQAVIWDVLFLDRLFGDRKLPIVNRMLVEWGYTPIPTFNLPDMEKEPPKGLYG